MTVTNRTENENHANEIVVLLGLALPVKRAVISGPREIAVLIGRTRARDVRNCAGHEN